MRPLVPHSDINTSADMAHSVRVLTTADELEEVREFWQKHQCYLESDIDYFLSEIALQKGALRPYVLVVTKSGRATGLLAGLLKEVPLDWRIGYMAVLRRTVRCLEVPYGGVLGDWSEDDRVAAATAVLSALRQGLADFAILQCLDAASVWHGVFREACPYISRDPVRVSVPHWTLDLKGSFQEFIGSRGKKTRSNIRYYARRIEKAFPNCLTVKCYSGEDDVERAAADADTVASKTYQRAICVGLSNTDELRAAYRAAARRGWLRVYILYAREEPIAFWAGFVYRRSFLISATGFDPAFHYYEPGQYLLIKMIEGFCVEDTMREVDFG